MSRRQLRRRLDTLAQADSLLEGQVRKGPHGRMEYSVAVLDMLRDLDLLAQRPGASLSDAADQLVQDIRGNGHRDAAEQGPDVEGQPVQDAGQLVEALREQVGLLKEQVKDLRSERDVWRSQCLDLQGRMLALQPPKRSLLARLLGR